MILFELTETEAHAAYQKLEVENGNRHYDFLRSAVEAALAIERPFLSQHVIKAINYHAIACLHTNPGEYRPCEVHVTAPAGQSQDNAFRPPEQYRVQALMDDFVNSVNRAWEGNDPVALAAYVLWRMNYIHPFINGNGRTARAASYFVLCVKLGGWLPGSPILPALIRQHKGEYVQMLKAIDAGFHANGEIDLKDLHGLMIRLLNEQNQSASDQQGDENA